MEMMRKNVPYVFALLGVIWLAIAAYAGDWTVLWPVVLCFVAAALLRMRPGERLTWAWATSTALMGLIIAAYQTYYWIPLLGGSLSSLAGLTAGGFAVFAVVHLVVLYLGGTRPAGAISAGQR